MNKSMKKVATYFRTRFVALRADERGAETMEIILILAVVIIILIPIVRKIVGKLEAKGNDVVTVVG